MINGNTELFGIIGDPVSHTASPKMHQAGFRSVGKNAIYVPFRVPLDQLAKALEGIRALGIKGVNVTIPHKEAVIPFLDEIHPIAKKIGAVNTIVNENGRLIGYNTDGIGFISAFKEESGTSFEGKHCVILGAGGSARAIAISVCEETPTSITIVNRTLKRANAIASHCKAVSVNTMELESNELAAVLKGSDIVINTTSIGMSPNDKLSPVSSFDWVTQDHIVCDIIYKPEETVFLKEAHERGAITINGLGMLAAQGSESFTLFTLEKIRHQLYKSEIKNEFQ